MAGGKLSPRQRMINLMYLVFIAMLALNMSKEVLSAFGLMNEKFESSNTSQTQANAALLGQISQKGSENASEYGAAMQKANQVAGLSDTFYKYLGTLKTGVYGHFEKDAETGEWPYQEMDKSTIDEEWFVGDNYTKKGQQIVDAFNTYRSGVKAVLAGDSRFAAIEKELDDKFDATQKIKNKDGVNIKYLTYHYQGFPAIATLAKLSSLQNDIKHIEAEIFNTYLGNALREAASYSNFEAIVIPEKSAFFAGEQFKGKVVLGKFDANTIPNKVSVNGSELDLDKAIKDGQVQLDFKTGNIGEHDINGKFTFMEEGKPVEIDIKGNYVVVPKPNSATISADKMNVVYRGVENPMTISFAGVNDNRVVANATGLKKLGNGKYMMEPKAGKEVTIVVSGELETGEKVSDKKTFRIKDLPKPSGTFLRTPVDDVMKLPRTNISVGDVGAVFQDFDFDLPLKVNSFKISVPGQPSVTVQGNKMNSQAQSAIKRAKRGDIIQIFDIKASAINNPVKIKNVSPISIEVAN